MTARARAAGSIASASAAARRPSSVRCALAHPAHPAVWSPWSVPSDFTQFLKAIQMQRDIEKRQDNEADFLAAFVAMVRRARRRLAGRPVDLHPAVEAVGMAIWKYNDRCHAEAAWLSQLDCMQLVAQVEPQRRMLTALLLLCLWSCVIPQGGSADRGGCVSSDKLRKVIKEDFALTFKVDTQSHSQTTRRTRA